MEIVVLRNSIGKANCIFINYSMLKQGSKLKKIPKSPFGDQLEKYSRQMQIFSHQFV